MIHKFCWRPFTERHIRQTYVSPCCQFNKNYSGNSYQIDHQEIRNSILKNEWHPGCSHCENIEKDNPGVLSHRRTYNKETDKKLIIENKFEARNIEIEVDNVCNLACITCNAWSSSKWASENKRMLVNQNIQRKEVIWDGILQTDFWKDAKTLTLYGGETMYSKRVLDLLSWLISNKIANNLELNFYTNGTIVNEQIISYLKEFKFTNISFSIDGVNERFETLRWPAKYSDVKQNFKTISLLENVKISIIYTYSILNACNLLDDLKVIRNDFIEKISLNMLFNPSYFAARHLPIELKKHLIEEYNTDDLAATVIGELLSLGNNVEFAKAKDRLALLDGFRNTNREVLSPIFL